MNKIFDMTNQDYHKTPEISSSNLKDLLVSPLYFKTRKNTENKSTPAMKLGTAVHSAILEPENFYRDIETMPTFKGTGSVKKKAEWKEENKGKTIITAEQNETVLGISQSFNKKPELKELFSGGAAEVSIFWDDWKVRPDYLKDDLVVDLKTTSKPLNEFNKSCANYMYDLSAWFYCYGADCNNYKFVVVEVNPPYDFVIFTPDAEFMAAGKEKALKAMDIYEQCKKYDTWPGVDIEQNLSLPSWYIGG